MKIEQLVNQKLNQYPSIKRKMKRAYQSVMCTVSHSPSAIGNIVRISPKDPQYEYFFGYYDKSPWDCTDRYMLCLRARDTWSDASPREKADILLIDTKRAAHDVARVRILAETNAWNVQQACMLQWLGPDYSSRILYNDFRDGAYCSVILTLETMEEKVLEMPVYTVSADGKIALTLDFSRLYNLRPGYGYYNVPERTKGIALPEQTAVWKLDLETGKVTELLKYTDFANFCPRAEMVAGVSVHKVNHLMLSPNGKRFMVLHRWFNGQRKYTRLLTCKVDGTDLYLLSDDDMVSHCCWKNNSSILAFENKKKTGPGYYLMKDKTQIFMRCWPQLSSDGHPSYSPNGKLIVTDTYPNRSRLATIRIMDANEKRREDQVIAKVFAPFRYDNDTRCDLHPRWNHSSTKICFDAVFEGHRGLYVVDVGRNTNENEFDMGQIRFIMPLHGFYNQLIQKSGYDIRDPYTGNVIYKRLFRELSFRLKLSNQSCWYNRENITDKRVIIVFEPLITPQYIEWLHRVNPHSRIILSYINKVNEKNNPDLFDFDWLEKWTGDIEDSKKYKINFYPGMAYFRVCKVRKCAPEYDVFYVGKDKGRIEQLLNLERQLNQLGLSTYFHIVAERKFSLKKDSHYRPFLPYEKVLEKIGKTRAILHLVNGGQVGITIRVMESLVHEVKLITDCKELKQYDFYHPQNIFILGEDRMKDLPVFIDSPYHKIESELFQNMYFEDMIQQIVQTRPDV